MIRPLCLIVLLFFALITFSSPARADDPPSANKPSLAGDQDAIRARYKRFNLTLQQMAEILRKQDPERADLLFRALGKSQESRIEDQMNLIFGLLNKEQPQLGEAIERQGDLVGQLKNLLELLQSEDRRSEIEKEKARLQELVKDINKLIGKEKDVRAGTERGDDAKKLADKQDGIAKDAEKLSQKIDKDDAAKNGETAPKPTDKPKSSDPKADGKSDKNDGKKPDGEKDKSDKDGSNDQDKSDKPGDKKTDDGKSDKDKSGDGSKNDTPKDDKKGGDKSPKSDPNQKPMDGQPKEGQPQDGQPQDGQPQDGQPQDGQESDQQQDPKQQKTPGRKQLQESREAMQRAIDELKKQKRDNASKEQDEAIRKLMEAKEKIEEILRQLREEEQKLMLATLEARFKKMLAAQLIIYHDTVRLAKGDASEQASVQARAIKLSQAEQEILIDADKALVLLKEEGSSIAFPETVSGVRSDIQSLVTWLRDANVGDLTQAVEKDVIEALEELVAALRKEMDKSDEEKKKQQQQQQQDGEQQNPLVDQLAELKMLRSLQLRVNRRTKQLGQAIQGEQATEAEAVRQLQDLSGRQARIQQATSDLVKGKNK